MSEGDVSLIHDEDVLRRLWQQTEDFSRKKEIRAHMYRLREERLRNLYSPEPTADGTKDLKELSNAGWNVESEDRTTDDGHTHVKSVNANIEGRYDVEGGKGQFAAVDHHTQSVTDYQDENSSLKRNESSSKTAAHEQVVRKTDDGSHFSSTTSSSSTSKYQQVSTRNETVPYTDDYNQRITDTNRNEQLTRDDYQQTLRSNDDHGELMSRKVEYPDDNTRVIVETRRLPDGTRVTSTRREFRVPVQSTRSEHHSQSRNENKYSTSHKTDQTASTKTIRHTENTIKDIVDSQRNVDNYDFKKHIVNDDFSETQSVRNYETNVTRKVIDSTNDENYSTTSRHETSRVSKKIIDNSNIDDDYQVNQYKKINRKIIDRNESEDVDFKTIRDETNRQVIDHSKSDDDYSQTVRYVTKINKVTDNNEQDRLLRNHPEGFDDVDRREITINRDDKNIHRRDIKDTRNTEDKIHVITRDTKEHIIDKKTTTDQYQTTYQTDYAQKKISTDWSPSHQAWASTLRSDTPSTTRPSTRASSPGSKTFKSSTSSLRSSVSPDKTSRKPSSRGTSPNKIDRYSPSRTVTDRYSSTHSTHSVTETKSTKHTGSDGRPPTGRSPTRSVYSPDRKLQGRQRPSVSPDKRPHDHTERFSASPERKPIHKPTDTRPDSSIRTPEVPAGLRQSPERKPGHQPTSVKPDDSIHPRTKSPQRFVSNIQPVGRQNESPRASPSPDRKAGSRTPIHRRSSPLRDTTRTKSPSLCYPDDTKRKPSVSPDRKPAHNPSDDQPKTLTDKILTRQSTSPDKKPGYMKPTASSQPSKNLKSPTKIADFITPTEVLDTHRPEDHTRISKVKEDHYKFINEETKIYENIDKVDINRSSKSIPDSTQPNKKSPSPVRKVPAEVIPDHDKISHDKEPLGKSGQKITIIDDKIDTTNVVTTIKKIHGVIEDITTHTLKPKDEMNPDHDREPSPTKYGTYNRKNPQQEIKDHPSKNKDSPKTQPHREPSPTKYGTYGRKHPQDEIKDHTSKNKDSPKPQPHREPSPTKYGTYNRKHPQDEIKDRTTKDKDSPKSQAHREPSPTKYGTYDRKHLQDEVKDRTTKDKDSPKSQPHREPSPTKYGTYDRKHPQDEVKDSITNDKDSPKSQPHREPPPTKYGTYDRKHPQDEVKDSITKDKDSPKSQAHREPSPIKYGTYDRKHLQDEVKNHTPKDKDSPKSQPHRELSPTKYGDYNKKQSNDERKDYTLEDQDSPKKYHTPQREPSPTKYGTKLPSNNKHFPKDEPKLHDKRTSFIEEDTIITTTESKDINYDSLTRREKITRESIEHPASPTKKAPRDSVSPAKSPIKDNKYKHTTDFLAIERSTDEINKRTSKKDHPRQLVTPSSSPTRKPKPEAEPSTGQSSPTTSVSGFVYFGSPPLEKTEVTDLDDQEYCTEPTTTEIRKIHERPNKLIVHGTPSPSKVPCRSPSPEKGTASPKDSLPRKSSLKKPLESYQPSPTEKPPSSFPISPDDNQDYIQHTVVKKDRLEPEGQEEVSKPKPLLERRETYEDRCKKILGMIDIKENVTKQTTHKHEPQKDMRSPCESSVPKDSSLFKERVLKNSTIEVSNFITHEKDNTNNTTSHQDVLHDGKPKIPRNSSPTKLQDIITSSKSIDNYNLGEKNLKENPEREAERRLFEEKPSDIYSHPDKHSEKTYEISKSKITRDTQNDLISYNRQKRDSPSRDSCSLDMKHISEQVLPTKPDTNKPTEKSPRESFSSRPSLSPERKPGSTKTITVTSKYTTSSIEDVQEAITTTEEKNSSTKSTESPTRQSPKTEHDETRSISPTTHVPKGDTSKRDISPTKQTPSNVIPIKKHDNSYEQSSSPDNSEVHLDYMRTTDKVTSKYDTYERDKKTTISKEEKRFPRKSSQSPSRRTAHDEEPRDSIVSKQDRHPDDQSPERKPRRVQSLSPTKDIASKSPEHKTLREPSPNKSDKSHEYTRTKDVSITKHDTSTTADINKITATKTVIETYPKRLSDSPTGINPEVDKPRNVSPSSPKKINDGRSEQTDKKQSSLPSEEFPIQTSTDRHPRESSPTSPRKTPGYMKTTTAISAKYDTVSSTEEFEKTTLLKSTEEKHSSTRISSSPTRQIDCTENTSYPKDNLSARDRLSPERKPGYCRPSTPTQDSSSKKPGVNSKLKDTSPSRNDKTSKHTKTTTAFSTKFHSVEDTDKILSSQSVDKKCSRPSVSPIQHKDQTKSTPEYPSITSPSIPVYTKDSTPSRDSLSPERKPKHQRPSLTNREDQMQIPENEVPNKSSPMGKIPSYIKTTTAVTTQHDTHLSAKDIEETITAKSVIKKHPNNDDSPTRHVNEHPKIISECPRTDPPSKPRYSEDGSTKSPERKPVYQLASPIQLTSTKEPRDRYPEDVFTTRSDESPGYMTTTTTFTSKNDTVKETLKSKTTEKKPRLTESPTRQNIESDHHRTPSPSRTYLYPNERSPERDIISPERKQGYKDIPTKKPENSQLKETSPTRKETTLSKYDTTSMIEENISTKTINKKQTTSHSPTRKSKELPKSGSQYPRENSPYTSSQPENKSSSRNSASPERKPIHEELRVPNEETPKKKPGDKHPHNTSPSRSDKVPGYMRTTTSVTSKYDTSIETDNFAENVKTTRKTTESNGSPKITTEHPRSASPTKPKYSAKNHSRDNEAPERKPGKGEPKNEDNKNSIIFTKTKLTDEEDTFTSKTIEKKHPSRLVSSPTSKISKDTFSKHIPGHTRTISPSKLNPKGVSTVNKPGLQQPSVTRDSPVKKPALGDKHTKIFTASKTEEQSTTSVISQCDTASEENIEEYVTSEKEDQYPSTKSSLSPMRYAAEIPKNTEQLNKVEEPRQLRTPSPIKKNIRVTEDSTDFIISEREQEVLHRVQKSLRKLSPEPKVRSPSPGKSPTKTTTSLHDLDIKNTETEELISNEINKTTEELIILHTSHSKPKDDKLKEPKVTSKARTVSPIKKPGIQSSIKIDKNPESPTKSRSISPKKPFGERPQSPQVSKIGSAKPKEQTPVYMTRKPTPATITTTKIEKAITMDVKKAIGTAKQNITKTTVKATASKFMSPTTKPESESKRVPTPKGIKDYPKKDSDTKVTGTTSDTTLKSKKTSPQRMKSKPEIQVNDLSPSKTPKSPKSNKEAQPKFPSKPKSATSLNTSTDEDDIIIDVQQSKSSRENSPDRICPTPVNFSDDVGTPRFPDQVSEPDDELRKRSYNTIHETESLVDDIVEICEDDELFVKRTNVKEISEQDDSLLSVHDKVSKFRNRTDIVTKPKDTTAIFRDTEIKSHSDFIDQNLKSDECLLSVSQKVNKFAKGPRDTRDSKSPSGRIVDEYDKHTIYQDDYTKLSVSDKAHLFVETAENIKITKTKPAQKMERPDLSNVDESLKSDDCLLSVSDKVNKFVKTAEQFFTDTHEVDEKDKKIKEQHDKIMRQIVGDYDDETTETTEYTEKIITENIDRVGRRSPDNCEEHPRLNTKATTPPHPRGKEYNSTKLKATDRAPPVKITTLRNSEAVKKAKALFENIATTTQKTEKTPKPAAKLTEIGVKNLPKTDTLTVSHPNVEDSSSNITYLDTEVDSTPLEHQELPSIITTNRPHDSKHRSSPSRCIVQSPERPRSKSPTRHTVETSTSKTVVIKHASVPGSDTPRHRPETDKTDKVPGYLRPTKTSQIKEEKVLEETEVSTRRGSGKFGVELRRTSIDRGTPTGERRRSVEHPCIEDIFDLDLLEQMLEKVTGYEQRRRIRAQIRVARKGDESNTFTKTTKTTLSVPKSKSSDSSKSPERSPKSPKKTLSPDRKSTPNKAVSQPKEVLITNGHSKETVEKPRIQQHESLEKLVTKTTVKSSSIHQSNLEKKARPQSPTKTTTKPKSNRFNEYASAYMKKVGLNETSKLKTAEIKKSDIHKSSKQIEEHITVEQHSTSKSFTERTSSRDVIETLELNGKRSPSPKKKQSPERKVSQVGQDRSPSPEQHRRKSDTIQTETTIKTIYDVDKKIQPKVIQEEKPSWITNRNLKKTTSETRTLSLKKIEPEKPKYRAASPSKVISKPLDAITSSYGPGPLDSDGKPLFGIKALRNTSSNYQVKGTVIRQEFHSRNGGEPEGTVSVTAYSTEPEELERLLQSQGAPPSRIHGLAAITTTRKFGGDTGTTIHQAHGKDERAVLEQFTHSDRRVSDFDLESQDDSFDRISETRRTTVEELDAHEDIGDTVYREETVRGHRTDGNVHEVKDKGEMMGDKKTVRKSSVKSLTEKFIKSANESSKTDRSSYPKAGLILRTATMKDSVSSDSSAHAGLMRTDSEHSLGSFDDSVVTTTSERIGDGVRTTTTTSTRHHERSFLDDSSKVTGVQDILTRMKNADIVIQDGDTSEDTEARALLNKFLGASVLMAGMQGYVTEKPSGKVIVKQETVRSSGGKVTSSRTTEEIDLDQCWDERVLKKLLEECSDYEQRRRLRARIRTLMAEQEACASAVTEALAAAGEPENTEGGETREEAEVTVTSSVRRDSSEKIVSSSTTTKTSKVTESMTRPAPKPVSPFAKFRQLEKQNSTTSPKM